MTQKSWFQAKLPRGGAAEILIYDDIGAFGIGAQGFSDSLREFGNVSDLTLRINSGGGDVFEGQAIYNMLRQHPAKVTVRVDGLAASSASLIAMAGDRIEMPEASWMMIHDPMTVVTMATRAEEHDYLAERLRDMKKTFVAVYSKRTGRSPDEIDEMMAAHNGQGTWMNGSRALELGFADAIIDAEPMAAAFDLSRYGKSVPAEVCGLFARGAAVSHSPASERVDRMAAEKNPAPAAEGTQPEKEKNHAPVLAKAPDHEAMIDKVMNEAALRSRHRQAEPQQEPSGKAREDRPSETERQIDIHAEAKRIAEERVQAIKDAYQSARYLGLEQECQGLIDEGMEAREIPKALIRIQAAKARTQSAIQNVLPASIRQGAGYSADDPATVIARMSDAITAQFVPGYMLPDASRAYMEWRPSDMMRELLERKGYETRRWNRSQIVDAALHTTSDFPELLGAAANKIFMGAYENAPATFRQVMSRVDLSNFQQHSLLRDGDFPSLQKVLESGEFTYGTISESAETARLATYGRTFAITRQALINDSLGVFGRMVAKIGQAVARFENKTAWEVVTTNAAMSDNVAFFHANHGNLAGSGTAISATTLGAARASMRVQKSVDGNVLNIAPRTLAVPAAKETLAEQTLSPLFVPPAAADIATTSMRTLAIIAEPLLDASSQTAWYLFSDPAAGAAFVYGYLEGEAAPRVRTNDPFSIDGIEFQVRMDFHASAADYRFAYKNAGA